MIAQLSCCCCCYCSNILHDTTCDCYFVFMFIMCTFRLVLFDFRRFSCHYFCAAFVSTGNKGVFDSFVPKQILPNYEERTNCAILDESTGLPIYNFAGRISSIKGLCIHDNTFNLTEFKKKTEMKCDFFPFSPCCRRIGLYYYFFVIWAFIGVSISFSFCSFSTI